MRKSNILTALAAAALATGITLLFTTDKGREIRDTISEKLTKEELEKLLEKIKREISKVENKLKDATDNTKLELQRLLKKLKGEKAEIEAAIDEAFDEL